jgi:cytochrome P450
MGTALLREVPVMDVRCADPEFLRDGYAVWDRVREAGAVVYTPGPLEGPAPMMPQAQDDAYLLTRFRETTRVMGNSKRFPETTEARENMERLFGDVVFEAIDNTARHAEIRGVWDHEFQRETLQERRLELVERVVREYLDPFLERVFSGESADAVTELHNAIPISVILAMLDLPMADRVQLHEWSATMSLTTVTEGTTRVREYLTDVVAERKMKPANQNDRDLDLISMMARSDVAKTMTDSEVIANCTQLVFAGAGTTSSLMSQCLVLLAQHPDQRRLMLEDRSLVGPAIEEVLRFSGGAGGPTRIVTGGDAEIGGFRVPEGAVLCSIRAAANRDPERWERPAEFNILRESKQHLGFGFGMHTCLGANLARLETNVYLNRLLDRLPEWEIALEIDLSKDPFFGNALNPIPSIPIVSN